MLSAAITFFAVSIYAPLTAKLEKAVHVNPSLFKVKEDVENKIIVYADKVDNLFYRPGTIDKIELINSSALKNLNNDKLKIDIKNEFDKIFSKMENRVDDYLNWYYSLNSEYVRLISVMKGDIENDMKTQLDSHLGKQDFDALLKSINITLDANKAINNDRQTKIKKVLADNLLPGDIKENGIVKSMSLGDSFTVPNYISNLTEFKGRLIYDGMAATSVSVAITAKLMSKGVFKLAAKPISKVVAKKAASTGVGTLAGGFIGSVIPGAGTLAGGAVGAIIASLILDEGLLKLEELTNRDEFKQEIINSIRKEKEEFINKLFNNTLMPVEDHENLIMSANQGNAEAQLQLGLNYKMGNGVEKNNSESVLWLRKSAEQGNSNAQFNLGLMYQNGTGIERNYSEALALYRKSADQGNATAQNLLALMYFKGVGIEKNDVEAVKWFRKSAEQGYADAQVNLGVMYQNGSGVEKNDVEAVGWFRKSAEQGNADAQVNLGAMYQNGSGVEKNDVEAVKWFRKSAEQENLDAQISLGVMYQKGDGVEKNNNNAIYWYKKASLITSKSDVRLFDTRTYSANFNQFLSINDKDEYVITGVKKIESFDYHKENSIKLPLNKKVFIGQVDANVELEADYKYFVKLTELKYVIDNETLVFTIPHLYLSTPVATEFSSLKRKCDSDYIATCKKTLNTMMSNLSVQLEARGKAQINKVYESAAESLANNFDVFAKNNDKGIFYKNIKVVFQDETGQPPHVINYNNSYCGDNPCRLEVPLGDGNILTIN